MADVNPKQQAQELIKQANHILLVSGNNLSDDQFCSLLAMKEVLAKVGKYATSVSTSNFPKTEQCFNASEIINNFDGARDLIVDIDATNTTIDTVKYDLIKNNLRITIRPKEGMLKTSAINSHYGAYLFDLVIVLGVSDFTNIDQFVTNDPSIFDGIHLINIDYHRINNSYGSVNIIDTNASSVCEMIIALSESLGYGPLGSDIASILFAGIVANTNRFANNNTTAKSMTMAAQMLAAGARHNEIIKVLSSGTHNNAKTRDVSSLNNNSKQNVSRNQSTQPSPMEVSEINNKKKNKEPRQDGLSKLTDKMANSKRDYINANPNSNPNNINVLSKDDIPTIETENVSSDVVITLEQEINQSTSTVPIDNNSEQKNTGNTTDIGLDISSSELDQFLTLSKSK